MHTSSLQVIVSGQPSAHGPPQRCRQSPLTHLPLLPQSESVEHIREQNERVYVRGPAMVLT